MMKTRGLIVWMVVLGVLGAGAYMALRKGRATNTIDEEETRMAVPDTAGVSKIFVASKGGSSHTLLRQADGTWLLDGKWQAATPLVRVLLESIHSVALRRPLARAERETVLKDLAAKHIKCEVYVRGEKAKTYYVGGPTQDNLGTYMLLDGADDPYVMQVPGFDGYLTPQYDIKPLAWRSKTLFSSNGRGLQRITVEYPERPQDGFTVRFRNPVVESKEIARMDTGQVVNWATYFRGVFLEQYVDERTMHKGYKDSLARVRPALVIEVEDVDRAKSKTLKVYNADPVNREERVLGIVEPGRELVTMQQAQLKMILRKRGDFERKG